MSASPLYDPSNYRPGQPGWSGQVGRLEFVNPTSQTVRVRLYSPDAPGNVFVDSTVGSGANHFLVGNSALGMDWGIQVDESEICILGLVADWIAVGSEHIFRTTPEQVALGENTTYDPLPYRPGTAWWGNQIGKVAMINQTPSSVFARLYHPDGPERVFGTYRIDPGQNLFLANGSAVGMDWGIQVNNHKIRILGLVSDWNFFENQHVFQTWPERLIDSATSITRRKLGKRRKDCGLSVHAMATLLGLEDDKLRQIERGDIPFEEVVAERALAVLNQNCPS